MEINRLKKFFSGMLIFLAFLAGCGENGSNVEEDHSNLSTEKKDLEKKRVDKTGDSTVNAAVNPKQRLWVDGAEVVVLEEYEEDALVKFCLDGYVVQMVVPKTLIDNRNSIKYKQDYDLFTSVNDIDPYYELSLSAENSSTGPWGSIRCIKTEAQTEGYWKEIMGKMEKAASEETGFDAVIEDKEFCAVTAGDRACGILMEDAVLGINVYDASGMADFMSKEKLMKTKAWPASEDDFVPITETKDYESRLEAVWEKLKKIEKDPSGEIVKLLGMDLGVNYYMYYLWDLTSDGIPEIIYYGDPRSVVIIGEKNVYELSSSDVWFSDEPGVIYGVYGWNDETEWTKYQFEANYDGELIVHADDVLKTDPVFTEDYSDFVLKYYVNGKEVDENAYSEELRTIRDPSRPRPIKYKEEELYADKKAFIIAGRRLNGLIK